MCPMVKTPLTIEYALLGFLRQRSMHAYEIHQQLAQAEALGLVWHVKQSQLYALITRLEDEGYLAGVTEQQDNRPAKRVLRLTPAGRDAFDRWLVTPVAHGRDFRLEFLAKLFFASHEGEPTLSTLIARQRQACDEQRVSLHARLSTLPPDRLYDALVLQFRIGQLDAILTWLETCRTALVAPVETTGQ